MSNKEKKERKKTRTGAASMSEITRQDVKEFVRKLEDPEARTFSSYEEMEDFIRKGGKL